MRPEEAAFLAAIRTAPDDDNPRMVYADWLEEFGGRPQRAEFIRVQVELARTPVNAITVGDVLARGPEGGVVRYDPDRPERPPIAVARKTVPSARHKELLARERELHDSVAQGYLASLPQAFDGFEIDPDLFRRDAAAGGPQMVGLLERGLCSHVVTNGRRWAKHGDTILAEHPVRRVTFTDAGPAVEPVGDYVVNDKWLHLCRCGGREVAVDGPGVYFGKVIAARWPDVPADGWKFPTPVPLITPDDLEYEGEFGDGTGDPGEHLSYP